MAITDARYAIERPKFGDIDTSKGALAIHSQLIANGCDTFEFKHDGIWGEMVVNAGVLRIYSRHGQLKFSVAIPHAHTSLNGVRVVCEFMHGSNWAAARNLEGYAFCFDVRVAENEARVEHKPLSERRAILAGVVDALQRALLSARNEQARAFGSKLVITATFSTSKDTVLHFWETRVLKEGHEGLVGKRSTAAFGVNWWRAKRCIEVDYVCMGFEASDAPKYKGKMVKSVLAGLYDGARLVHVANVSGLTDAQRAEFFQSPTKFIGRVFKTSGKRIFPSGAVRHPSFEGWHLDKQATECTLQAALKAGGSAES